MRLREQITAKRVLAGVCLLSAALMVLPPAHSRRVSHAARSLLVPLGDGGRFFVVHVRKRVGRLAGRGGADDAEHVRQLTDQVRAMYQTIRSQQERIASLEFWRSRDGLGPFPCRLVPARIVGAEAISLRRRRLINKGDSAGAAPGDLVTTRRLLHQRDFTLPDEAMVLGHNYVVGRIIDCAPYSATLQLITDPKFSVPARLWRMVRPGGERTYLDGARQVVVGHSGRTAAPEPVGPLVQVRAEGDGRQVVCRNVPAEHRIAPGDVLTTAGETRLLPFGMKVGVVTGTRREPNAHFVSVYVRPFADPWVLREVYVVIPLGPDR